MRKVINEKVYDTKTAELIHQYDNGRYTNDFRYRSKDLYRTKKGNWFIHHEGGPMTDMAVPVGSNSTSGSESIEPISEEHVIRFLESHGGDEVLLEMFSDKLEEA